MKTKHLKQMDELEQLLDIKRAAKLAVLEREYIDRTAAIEKDHKRRVKAVEKARNIIQTAFALVRVFKVPLPKSLPMVGGGFINNRPEEIIPRDKRKDL